MNYEKKYKEIVGQIKKAYLYAQTDSTKAVLEEIFPELKDSEDEKVRKALLEMVHDTTGDELLVDYNVHKEEALAWLEKQGEKLPAGFYYVNSEGKKFYSEKFKYGNVVLGISANNGKDEQKPSTEVEPKFKVGDKIYLKPEYRMPSDDTPIANTVKEIIRIDDKHYRFDGSYIFIEDQDKYELVEQKPEENKGNIGGISANWSEEDEENFCSVYLDVKSARQNTVNSLSGELKEQEQKRMDEVISWLKSLKGRVQPKQEWNEEDEKRIKKVMHILSLDGRISNEELKSIHDWLKSLRPHNRWKPSDEQMEALYKASKNEYLKADQYDVLSELWNNLKKLKEG